MQTRSRAAAAALLALLALGPWHAATACTVSSARGLRWPGDSHLIALPTGRMVSAARGLPPALARVGPKRSYHDRISTPREWRWWRGRLQVGSRRLRNAFRLGPPYGQVARIERVGGPDSGRVVAALAQSGGEVVVVRWLLTAACGDALSESREPWLAPGERVFMTAVLRDQAGWVDGRPTFDIRSAAFPYRERPSWGDASRAEPWLSLEEYWRLYEALPAHAELERDSAAALAPLRAWARLHQELVSYPLVRREVDLAARYAESLTRPSGPNRR